MKKILNQKKVLFPLIFVTELVILIVIANIFDLETDNTLYGAAFAYILFITIIWFLIRIIKDHKKELSVMVIPLYKTSVLHFLYFLTGLLIAILTIGCFYILRIVLES